MRVLRARRATAVTLSRAATHPLVPLAVYGLCAVAAVRLDRPAVLWFAMAGAAGYALSGST